MIDEIDKKIIEFLLKDGRMPVLKMSKSIGITEAAIRKRIKKLESKRIIKGYEVVVHPENIGIMCHAIIGIDAKPEMIQEVISKISKIPEARRVYHSAGEHPIFLEVWVKDNEELNRFIKENLKIQEIDGISTTIVLKKIK